MSKRTFEAANDPVRSPLTSSAAADQALHRQQETKAQATRGRVRPVRVADPQIMPTSAASSLAFLEEELAYIRREREKWNARFRKAELGRRTSAYASDLEAASADLRAFDPQRLRDITDFDYRFRHRARLAKQVANRLEHVAAKLMYTKRDGGIGYFGRLVENGIDYKSEASVVASLRAPWADAYCRCGIWTRGYGGPRNSGRCHHHQFCRLCSWMDYGKLIKDSFGAHTGTFSRALRRGVRFHAVHLSVRDNPANASAIGRELFDSNLRTEMGAHHELYDARPVEIDGTDGNDDITGLLTCQYCFLACSTALRAAYHRGLVSGIKSRIEVAIDLCPTRALPHAHAIVTAPSSMDPKTLAENLKEQMDAVLVAHAGSLQVPLFASVRVYTIGSAEHLEKAALYLEKVIPLGLIVKGALSRLEALAAGGRPEEEMRSGLEHGLENLSDQLDSITTGFRAHGDDLQAVRTRLSLGNLRFGKACLLDEPEYHRQYRLKKAAQQRAKRKARQLRKLESMRKTRRPVD